MKSRDEGFLNAHTQGPGRMGMLRPIDRARRTDLALHRGRHRARRCAVPIRLCPPGPLPRTADQAGKCCTPASISCAGHPYTGLLALPCTLAFEPAPRPGRVKGGGKELKGAADHKTPGRGPCGRARGTAVHAGGREGPRSIREGERATIRWPGSKATILNPVRSLDVPCPRPLPPRFPFVLFSCCGTWDRPFSAHWTHAMARPAPGNRCGAAHSGALDPNRAG